MYGPAETAVRRRRGLSAPLALPAGFGALLVVGAVAAAIHAVSALWVLVSAGVIVLAGSFLAEPAVAPVLAAIGWLTVVGFSGPPYAQLRMTGPLALRAVVVMLAAGAGRDRCWRNDAQDQLVVHTVCCEHRRRAPPGREHPGRQADAARRRSATGSAGSGRAC